MFIYKKQRLLDTYKELDDYDQKQDFPIVDDALVEKLIKEKVDEPKNDEIKVFTDAFDVLTNVEKQTRQILEIYRQIRQP